MAYKIVGTACVNEQGSVIECGTVAKAEAQLLVLNIAPPARPMTDITVTTTEPLMINTVRNFPFTTNLPAGVHPMPVRHVGTDELELFAVTVSALGDGTFSPTFNKSGIYYIDINDLKTDLKINGDLSTRFTVYVMQ